jgi:hypothetical protein
LKSSFGSNIIDTYRLLLVESIDDIDLILIKLAEEPVAKRCPGEATGSPPLDIEPERHRLCLEAGPVPEPHRRAIPCP